MALVKGGGASYGAVADTTEPIPDIDHDQLLKPSGVEPMNSKLKILNVILMSSLLMAWFGCVVAFRGILAQAKQVGTVGYVYFYWDRICNHEYQLDEETTLSIFATPCKKIQSVFIGFAGLSFTTLNISLVFAILRVSAQQYRIPYFGYQKDKYLNFEMLLLVLSFLFFVVMSASWGDKCYSAIVNFLNNPSAPSDPFVYGPTGFAYICFVTGSLFIMIFIMVWIRKLELIDSSWGRSSSELQNEFSNDPSQRRVSFCDRFSNLLTGLCWVGGITLFFGPLMITEETFNLPPEMEMNSYYYYNRLETWTHSFSYTDQTTLTHAHVGTSCARGGTALLACGVLAFIGCTVKMVLNWLRRLNHGHIVPIVGGDKAAYLNFELFLSFWNLLFFFLMSVIWGTTCYQALESTNDNDSFTLRPTGYAYICVCSGFAFLSFLMTIYIRRKLQPSNPFASHPAPQPPSPKVDQDAL